MTDKAKRIDLRQKAGKPAEDEGPEAVEAAEAAQYKFAPRSVRYTVQYMEPGTGLERTLEFTSTILRETERVECQLMMGRLTAGVPWSNLPRDAQVRFVAIAHVSYQLGMMDKEGEKRNKALREFIFEDDELLFAVHEKCREHEDRFFRGGPQTRKGLAGRERVVVSSIDLA